MPGISFIRGFRQHRKTITNIRRNQHKRHRKLEIGPGPDRFPDFETLNIVDGDQVDYICDATRALPFQSNSFELIYASHILEHVPWYQTADVLSEWVRILEPGGKLKIWVPNALLICKALVDFELLGINEIDKDGWYRFNPEKDPCKWAAGRMYTYGDGTGNPSHPNWHRALFTPRYLKLVMQNAGLQDIRTTEQSEILGHDHGWINLGLCGTKP